MARWKCYKFAPKQKNSQLTLNTSASVKASRQQPPHFFVIAPTSFPDMLKIYSLSFITKKDANRKFFVLTS